MNTKHARDILEAHRLNEIEKAKWNLEKWLHPKPGIHEVPRFVYDLVDAVNYSRFKLVKTSPYHFHQARPTESAKHFRLGDIIHERLLTPRTFKSTYGVIPTQKILHQVFQPMLSKTGTTKYILRSDPKIERTRPTTTEAFKEAVEEYKLKHGTIKWITQEEHDLLKGIVSSMNRKPLVRRLFQGGQSEIMIVWKDPTTDLLCKALIDHLQEQKHFCRSNDIKSTRDILEWITVGLPKDLDYHLQAYHYSEGVKAVTGKECIHTVVPIEKAPPYDCIAAPIHPDDLAQAKREYTSLMKLIAKCYESDSWPGVGSPKFFRLSRFYDRERYLVSTGVFAHASEKENRSKKKKAASPSSTTATRPSKKCKAKAPIKRTTRRTTSS